MMDKKEIDYSLNLYCSLMNEVKKRTFAVTEMLTGHATTSFLATNIEFLSLQIRKILELVSMGSLVLNKNEFEAVGMRYASFWNARLILQDIERLNPDFYPIAIDEIPSHRPGIINDLKIKTEGFLTRESFVEVYEKCGKIMHAYNPFGSKYDYDYYKNKIIEWEDLIIGLLNCHLIHIMGLEGFFLIHMQEDRDENVHGYFFERVDTGIGSGISSSGLSAR